MKQRCFWEAQGMAEKQNQIVFDSRFWLQLLGDRARLVFRSLSPDEIQEAQTVNQFIADLDALLKEARKELTEDALKSLGKRAERSVQDFRKYILYFLRRQITGDLVIDVNPATLNMIVNSAEIYLGILNAYLKGSQLSFNSLILASIWLQNVYIDSIVIQNDIGIIYYEERQRAGEFASLFLNHYYTATIMDGLHRTGLSSFPALDKFNDQVQRIMISYAEYLVDLIYLITKIEYIGSLSLLFVDSTYRQVCYYMTKLSEVSAIKPPACDPSSPRMELGGVTNP